MTDLSEDGLIFQNDLIFIMYLYNLNCPLVFKCCSSFSQVFCDVRRVEDIYCLRGRCHLRGLVFTGCHNTCLNCPAAIKFDVCLVHKKQTKRPLSSLHVRSYLNIGTN